jgi:hypothetical protein
MDSCLATLDELGRWEDDLEIEALSSIRSATLVIIVVFGHTPLPNTALTTLVGPTLT